MRRTEQTLVEQMQINDVEIQHRMNLLGLSSQCLASLINYKPLIESAIEKMVDEFYKKQTEVDEISLLIGDADTLTRLRDAQRQYIIDLFCGCYENDYVNNRLRIGMVHKRIGVEPKLYLSAVCTLKELIFDVLRNTIKDHAELNQTLTIIDKLIYFDTTLVFDTYIASLVGEIENAKRRTEVYAKGLEEKVAQRTHELEKLAKLDPLTNLYNRREMQELFQRELARARRQKLPLTIVYFDLDNFKSVNDTQGHLKGDEVLKFIGKYLKKNTREIDIACRYGGDEFCLIMPDCDVENTIAICNKLIVAFEAKYPPLHLSFGIISAPLDSTVGAEELINRADRKMYEAKKHQGSHIIH
ncbi:GGDEF domain-containing protein [Pseudoalteromonas sp. MT33b]|uniref:GGDEF domain-containing protein n=1 Tax=Pseudoalteromonas sp. MT33b TaxID=2759705 RepID=UPI0015F7C18E|nr:GGDEF domain-containing protein [Pseudoalteromonas sp. MT33b]QMW15640.1 GGDEF domain-containing protein [Pseudoalteromonas sp. MT33b]